MKYKFFSLVLSYYPSIPFPIHCNSFLYDSLSGSGFSSGQRYRCHEIKSHVKARKTSFSRKTCLQVHVPLCGNIFPPEGLFIWGELVQLSGLVHPGEMIFIPRSYGICYVTSIKKFVMSLEKNLKRCKVFHFFYNKQWRKAAINKLLQKLGSFMQNNCSYII